MLKNFFLYFLFLITPLSVFALERIDQEEPFEYIAAKAVFNELEESLITIHEEGPAFSLITKIDQFYYTYQSFDQPTVPAWLKRKISDQVVVASFGDDNSFFGKLTQNLEALITLESLKSLSFTLQYPNELYDHTVHLINLMEQMGIQSIHYRPTVKEFPTDLSFTEWPETIVSLDSLYCKGITVSPVTGEILTKGFVVSLENHSQVETAAVFFEKTDSHTYGKALISSYLQNKAKLFLQSNIYLGIWHDTSSDLVFLDLSEVFENMEEAIQAGKERNQIAIFDLSTGSVIFTGGDGGVSKTVTFNLEIEHLQGDYEFFNAA